MTNNQICLPQQVSDIRINTFSGPLPAELFPGVNQYERINQRSCKLSKYSRREPDSKRTDIRHTVPREAAPDASGWLAQRSERTLSDGWCVPRIFPVLPI